MSDSAPIATLDFQKNGGIEQFRTLNDVQAFLNDYVNFWSFVNETDVSKVNRTLRNDFTNRWHALSNLKDQFNSNPPTGKRIQRDLENSLTNTNHPIFPVHTSGTAELIRELFDSGEHNACLSALSHAGYNNQHVQITNKENLAGVLSLAIHELGVTTKGSAAIRRSLRKLEAKQKEQIELFKVELESTKKSVSSELEKSDASRTNQAEWLKRQWVKEQREMLDQVNRATGELHQTKLSYEETMALKAPSRYWKLKGQAHSTSAKVYGFVCIIYTVAILAAGYIGIRWLFETALAISLSASEAGQSVPTTALLILSGSGFLASTIAFWGGRIFIRLFLSEVHLAMDANERRTMVMSYLALVHKGKADSEDRKIILEALFRPTEDGIVKDDASADPNFTGVINRAIGNR